MTIPIHGAFERISAAVLFRPPDHEFYQKWTEFAPNPPRQIRVFRDEAEIRRTTDNFCDKPGQFACFRREMTRCVVFNKLPRYEFKPLCNNLDAFSQNTRCDDYFLKVS